LKGAVPAPSPVLPNSWSLAGSGLMSLISDMANQLVSWVLRLVFGLFALAFALSLLAAGLIAVFFMLLRSLLTGRKPAPVMVWQRYRDASRASSERWTNRTKPPGTPGPSGAPTARGARPASADVEDVTPRDIPPH
jgi:hypothetical protein